MAKKDIIKLLREQVENLIASHEKCASECRELIAERDRLAAQKRGLEERVRELEERVKSLELSGAMSGAGGDVERAKQRVTNLLREIDRCIDDLKHQQEQS
jgi:outer membrane murein-binding lipoprotein Lpp